MKLRFTLWGPPRTKKTHGTIAAFGRPCRSCGRPPFSKLVPSEQFQEFEKFALAQGPTLRKALKASGVELPILVRVGVRAAIYRDADTGDWNGYTDALADVLGQPMYSVPCPDKDCVTPKERKRTRIKATFAELERGATLQCSRCGLSFRASALGCEQARDGLGIIGDDSQIEHWDGTRLLVDRARPRIEVEVETLEGRLF